MRILLKIIGIVLMLLGFFLAKSLHYEGEPDMQHIHNLLVWGLLAIGFVFMMLGRKKKKEAVKAQ
jgi:membrane protein DedA with SNARE-associated domain